MLGSVEPIKLKKDDSPDFIELINKINSIMIFQYGIDELYYIRIKNWFDHKWLNYSGKAVVPFESGGIFETDAALEVRWQNKITVPPFNPTRVLSETFTKKHSYIKEHRNDLKITKNALHVFKSSNDNLHNRINQYSKNGLFVWYSSNTKINKRGSLMIYRVQENDVETFYASFEKKDIWEITQTKGIGLNELKVYISESKP